MVWVRKIGNDSRSALGRAVSILPLPNPPVYAGVRDGRIVRNFYTQPLPHMGFMAEIAQLWFAPGGTTEDYFDLSSALTAANRKHIIRLASVEGPFVTMSPSNIRRRQLQGRMSLG